MTPADAIREFVEILVTRGIAAQRRFMSEDFANLRRVYPTDKDFTQALRAVTGELSRLRKNDGSQLEHALGSWRRVKFSSGLVDFADLRIIFRFNAERIELNAFGHRQLPESVYLRAKKR